MFWQVYLTLKHIFKSSGYTLHSYHLYPCFSHSWNSRHFLLQVRLLQKPPSVACQTACQCWVIWTSSKTTKIPLLVSDFSKCQMACLHMKDSLQISTNSHFIHVTYQLSFHHHIFFFHIYVQCFDLLKGPFLLADFRLGSVWEAGQGSRDCRFGTVLVRFGFLGWMFFWKWNYSFEYFSAIECVNILLITWTSPTAT